MEKFAVTKENDNGQIVIVAECEAKSIKQAMNKMFGKDWEVHNTMGYLIATKPSTSEHIGILWITA
jgi:16S rRNA G1207 methylase RsmC